MISIVNMVTNMYVTIVMDGPMLLELVQYLVTLCSEGSKNEMISKKACQCLGLIGVRDFGAVSLSPHKHTGKKMYT